jgi:hypothetical protein
VKRRKSLCVMTISTPSLSREAALVGCGRDDLLKLFRSSEVEEADAIATRAKSAMSLDVPPADCTENSYISFWDEHIAFIISQLVSKVNQFVIVTRTQILPPSDRITAT